MFKSSRKPAGRAADTSLIAAVATLRGDVRFSGALHVSGCIEGCVQAEPGSGAVFTLSEQGRVIGEVRVPHAVINGEVRGDIHAGERLELAAGARVDGDVHYRLLERAAGARINGRMVHTAEAPLQLAAPAADADPA